MKGERENYFGCLSYLFPAWVIVGIFIMAQNSQGRQEPLLDCGNGRTDASVDLKLDYNKDVAVYGVNRDGNILVKAKPDGGLVVNFNNGTANKQVTLPSGETVALSQVDINADNTISFEDNGINMRITDKGNYNNQVVVGIEGKCRR